VVRVGKRFADNFYAAYERSLSGAMGTLFVFYDVSRLLTVRAEAGERTGVDLIFTFSFDAFGPEEVDRVQRRSNTRQVVVACAYSVPSGRTASLRRWPVGGRSAARVPSARTRCTFGPMARTRFTPSSAVV
jgi:hypothetical protein